MDAYFEHEGHRTVVSQRALQVHTDPLLGYTELDGVGYVVSEVSPYEVDLDWGGLTEPDEIAEVVTLLGRATAKIHCASDEDSDQDLVDFQVEEAIARSLEAVAEEFTAWVTDFGMEYAEQAREDHVRFVNAFREGRIGVSATWKRGGGSEVEPSCRRRRPPLSSPPRRPAALEEGPAGGRARRTPRPRRRRRWRGRRVDPLLGDQGDRRAAEPAAGHPGPDGAGLDRGRHGDVQLGQEISKSSRIDACEARNSARPAASRRLERVDGRGDPVDLGHHVPPGAAHRSSSSVSTAARFASRSDGELERGGASRRVGATGRTRRR